MRTIKTTATVNDRGLLTIKVPVDIEPGEYEVAITVAGGRDEQDDVWPLKLIPLRLDAWPPNATFSREEIYDDDGR